MDASPAARRVALVALGCRVSRSDAEALAGCLGAGLRPARAGERADWVVVSACTVTAGAASASRRAVRRALRDHPGARIVVAGCHGAGDADALSALPGVAAVVGACAHAALPGLIARLDAGVPRAAALGGALSAAPPWTGTPRTGAGPARPILKVQDGCDGGCSYCAVPAARGRSRSLEAGEAVRRLEALGRERPEVVVSGVHLGAYGRDLAPASSLAELVRATARRRAVRRVRLSSIDPLEVPLPLLREDAADLLCRHLHLPVQSGSDRVLDAMRRPGRSRAVARAVETAAQALPGACLGADVMAGFPGETEEDHRRTLGFLEALPVDYLHVFAFSPRPGTPAAALPGRPPAEEVSRRTAELRALSARRWDRFLASRVGRELEVVVERVGPGGAAAGTSSDFAPVRLEGAGLRRGDLVRVLVAAVAGGSCTGTVARVAWRAPPGGGEPSPP